MGIKQIFRMMFFVLRICGVVVILFCGVCGDEEMRKKIRTKTRNEYTKEEKAEEE